MTMPLTLKLSKDFKIPDIYLTDSIESIQEALWIGATIQQSVHAYRADSAVQVIQDTAKKEVDALKQRIAMLQSERCLLEESHQTAIRITRSNASDTVRKELSEKMASIENQLALVEERRRFVEDAKQEDIRKAVEAERACVERIIKEKEKEIGRLDTTMRMFQELLTKQTEEIQRINGTITKKATAETNVKVKGSAFEDEFHARITAAYGTIRDFDLKDTAHGGGHEGDKILTIEGEQVMWEQKSYSGTVPKAEVEKFIRDVRGTRGISVAVMASKTSDIVGRHGAIVLEQIEGRLFIFINRFEEWSGGEIFQILLQLFRFWWRVARRMDDGGEKSDGAKEQIEDVIKEVQKQLEVIGKRKTEWRTHKARIEDGVRFMTDMMKESMNQLEYLLKILRPEDNCERQNTIVVPQGALTLFKDSRDAKIIKWRENILQVCAVGNGYIELRDLVDLLADGHKISKDTIRTYVLSAINEEFLEKKGSVKIINGLVKSK